VYRADIAVNGYEKGKGKAKNGRTSDEKGRTQGAGRHEKANHRRFGAVKEIGDQEREKTPFVGARRRITIKTRRKDSGNRAKFQERKGFGGLRHGMKQGKRFTL